MELEVIRQDEEVYEAAATGNVETLNTLIQKDRCILTKLSSTTQTQTPLHVSASLGHAEFTKTLLTHNPKLAEWVDSAGRTPLHLAAAEGHKETVRVLLLSANADALCRDGKGRIPLHYAAMRGEVEVVMELIEAKPESVYVRVESRSKETVLHLCVKYHQLECLRVLVEKVGQDDGEFLNSRAGCDSGMTILHLALVLRQIQTIRYLFSLAVIRAEAINTANGMSLTVFDVLEHGSLAREDFSTTLEIQQILLDAGISRERTENDLPAAAVVAKSPNVLRKPKKKTNLQNGVAKVQEKGANAGWYLTKFMRLLKYPSQWLVETRGMLMVVATMISAMTFQAIVNPPGGVWQENNTNSTNIYGNPPYIFCTEDDPCFAGTTILGYIWKDDFFDFVRFNTVSFLASLSVTLLLISGFPLNNRVCMWLLSMAMCVTLTFIALTYLKVLLLVMPFQLFGLSLKMYKRSFRVWIGLLVIVGVMHTSIFYLGDEEVAANVLQVKNKSPEDDHWLLFREGTNRSF